MGPSRGGQRPPDLEVVGLVVIVGIGELGRWQVTTVVRMLPGSHEAAEHPIREPAVVIERRVGEPEPEGEHPPPRGLRHVRVRR